MRKKLTLFVSSAIFCVCLSSPVSAGGGMSTILVTDAPILRPAIAIPKPISIPTVPQVPTTVCPVPPIAKPVIDQIKTNPAKGGRQVAVRKTCNTRKAAKEKATFKGGGKPPGHDPNGHKDDKRPHYHPHDSHDHYYYPKTVVVAKGDTLWGIAKKYGLDHNQLAKINGIVKPDLIKPGQVIKLG